MADPLFPSVDPGTNKLREQHMPDRTVFSSDVDTIVKITQSAYTALSTKDSRTIYLITP